MTKEQIGNIDGGKTALVLCGYGAFGDCQSIRHRLTAARAKVAELKKYLAECKPQLGAKDEVIVLWEREVKVWEYAIVKGEKLLARELKKEQSSCS